MLCAPDTEFMRDEGAVGAYKEPVDARGKTMEPGVLILSVDVLSHTS